MSAELSEKAYRNSANRERMGGLRLAEEAIAFLRLHGQASLLVYGLGTLPFVGGLILCAGLMLHSLYGHLYLEMAALLLTVLYFVMKWAQHRYMRGLYRLLRGESAAFHAEGKRHPWRAFAYQSVTHTLGLFALPIMTLLLFPIPWYIAFLNTVSVLDNNRHPSLRALWSEAYRLVQLWTRQSFMLFWLLSPLAVILLVVPLYTLIPVLVAVDDYVIFAMLVIYLILGGLGIFFVAPIACVVFINLGSGLLLLMTLFVSFSGMETRDYFLTMVISDTVFWLGCAGLCYLVMDPVLKCAFVLRVFHAQSLKTGDDLHAALQRIQQEQEGVAVGGVMTPAPSAPVPALGRASQAGIVLLLGVAALLGSAMPAQAQDSAPVPIPVVELEASVQETLSQQRYAWRLPRDFDRSSYENPIYTLVRNLLETAKNAFDRVMGWLDDLADRLGRQLAFGDGGGAEVAWYILWGLRVLIAVLVVILLYMLYRALRTYLRERKDLSVSMPSLSHVLPDIQAEDVHAGDLPEEDWLGMAQDLAEQGDYRAAMRAVYLGMLAGLARQEYLHLARYKSNAEYLRELQRRMQREAQSLQAFHEGTRSVEAVWYGGHPANPDQFQRMRSLYTAVTAHD